MQPNLNASDGSDKAIAELKKHWENRHGIRIGDYVQDKDRYLRVIRINGDFLEVIDPTVGKLWRMNHDGSTGFQGNSYKYWTINKRSLHEAAFKLGEFWIASDQVECARESSLYVECRVFA